MMKFEGTKVFSADFLVIVRFRQWYWPRPLERRVRFKADRDNADRWVWLRPFMSEFDRNLRPATDITMLPPTDERMNES